MPMKDSRMTDEWIAAVIRSNPIKIAEKTGNIITCPVRLNFTSLWSASKSQDASADKAATYNTVIMFPPGANEMITSTIVPPYIAALRQAFPNNFGADGQPFGLHSPFRDQKEKQQYPGYTPGCLFISAGTQFKPQIVDPSFNPIVDESRVYDGVWAIVALNLYPYGIKPVRPKKGVSFGLQSIMIFADDEHIKPGGKAAPPQDDFAGINIDNAYNPTAAFGNTPTAAPSYAAPASILPPATPVSAPPPMPPVAPPAPAVEPMKFW